MSGIGPGAAGDDSAPADGQPDRRQSPELSAPVQVGPIAASSYGGIAFIAIKGSIHQFSGKRLATMVMSALNEAGVTIEIPEEDGQIT